MLLAFSAVLASLGLFALTTHVSTADYQSTSAVILLIGMAVGIDYSLFYLRREREERAGGAEPRTALVRAAATSGQAVLISGATVLIAMAGMFIAGNKIFTGMAIGTMLVVLSAVIGSVTVLPAALSKLGDRVDRGRVPYFGKRKHAAGESRFWAFVLDRVLRRPVASIAIAGGLLLLAASPLLSMHTKLPSFTDMPRELPIVKTYKSVIAAFPGAPTPAELVVRAPDVRAARRAGDDRAVRAAGGRDRADVPADHDRSRAPTTRSSTSASRSPATATTRPRSPRSRRCAPSSCRTRSARSRPSSTRSPARRPARTTSTSR